MEFKRGYIYTLDDGWGDVRLLEMFQEYESFNPEKPGDKYVKLRKVDTENTPFRMKLEMFKSLVDEVKRYKN